MHCATQRVQRRSRLIGIVRRVVVAAGKRGQMFHRDTRILRRHGRKVIFRQGLRVALAVVPQQAETGTHERFRARPDEVPVVDIASLPDEVAVADDQRLREGVGAGQRFYKLERLVKRAGGDALRSRRGGRPLGFRENHNSVQTGLRRAADFDRQ